MWKAPSVSLLVPQNGSRSGHDPLVGSDHSEASGGPQRGPLEGLQYLQVCVKTLFCCRGAIPRVRSPSTQQKLTVIRTLQESLESAALRDEAASGSHIPIIFFLAEVTNQGSFCPQTVSEVKLNIYQLIVRHCWIAVYKEFILLLCTCSIGLCKGKIPRKGKKSYKYKQNNQWIVIHFIFSPF